MLLLFGMIRRDSSPAASTPLFLFFTLFHLPKNIYKNITNNNFNELGLSNIIEYVSVGGKTLSMPIVDVGSVKIDDGNCVKKFDCVLGISSQPFAEKGYECLLHRDFV